MLNKYFGNFQFKYQKLYEKYIEGENLLSKKLFFKFQSFIVSGHTDGPARFLQGDVIL